MFKAGLQFVLIAVALFIASCSQLFAQSSQIRWLDDFDLAVRYASTNNVPLMLHFYGESCPPCRMLEKRAFLDSNLVGKINNQMIAVKINGDRQRELRDRYQITSWPTDVFLTPTGEELYRTTSPQDPAVYGQMVDRVAHQFSDWKVAQMAKAKYEERRLANRTSTQLAQTGELVTGKMVGGPASHPVVTNSRNSETTVQSQNPQFQSNRPQLTAQPQAVVNKSLDRQRMIENPFVQQGSLPVPAANQAPPSPSSTASQPGQIGSRPVNAPIAPAISPQQPVVIPQTPSTTTQETKVVVQPISRQQTRSSDSLQLEPPPAETLRHGLDGFCPVSLSKAVQTKSPECWIEGQPEFAVRHRGRIYLCSSEENRLAFLSAPDRYAPVLSNYDLIHFVKTGELIDGKCEFGAFQPATGKVFLFANQQNCLEFQNMEQLYTDLLRSSESERVANRVDASPIR